MTKIEKNVPLEKKFDIVLSKIAIYLSLGLYKDGQATGELSALKREQPAQYVKI
jgi:hypothetical protein